MKSALGPIVTRCAGGVSLLLLTAGCNFGNKEHIRFLALWNGKFKVEKVLTGPDSPQDRARYELKGYIKILSNKSEFWIHLEGEQQAIDIKGTYKIEKDRIQLRASSDTRIDDFGGEDKRNPNLKFIPIQALKDSYAKPIILDLSKDGLKLTGLTFTLGPVEGQYEFEKAYK